MEHGTGMELQFMSWKLTLNIFFFIAIQQLEQIDYYL